MTDEEKNSEYVRLCGILGHLVFQQRILHKQAEDALYKLTQLTAKKESSDVEAGS
jgi:hypothetical protein